MKAEFNAHNTRASLKKRSHGFEFASKTSAHFLAWNYETATLNTKELNSSRHVFGKYHFVVKFYRNHDMVREFFAFSIAFWCESSFTGILYMD